MSSGSSRPIWWCRSCVFRFRIIEGRNQPQTAATTRPMTKTAVLDPVAAAKRMKAAVSAIAEMRR